MAESRTREYGDVFMVNLSFSGRKSVEVLDAVQIVTSIERIFDCSRYSTLYYFFCFLMIVRE
jgi:hypothetical protein